MAQARNSSDYIIIAPLFSGKNINVSVTFKGENLPENLYILNEFPYNKNDLSLFKKIFFAFSSPERPKEFVDFFVIKEKFYAVFKYFKAESIHYKYDTNLNTQNFDERCRMLENILVKLYKDHTLPIEVVACISEKENICVDLKRNIHIIYNLKNISSYKGADDKVIFEHIADIIFTMLQPEAKAGFNKSLHIVIDKCKRGVYASIPELIIELKKAEKVSKASSWFSYAKYQLSLRKNIINKINQFAIITAIFAGFIYIIYSKINENNKPTAAVSKVAIGDTTYNAGSEDDSDKKVSAENDDNQTKASSADIVLTEGLDMEYEDYIIQYGDSVASICESYYKDPKYITAIATFNGIEISEKLTPGSILKLPNRTAIALYISK